jgi:hypothetical protein
MLFMWGPGGANPVRMGDASLWRGSDACAAWSLPLPIHSCRTLTAGMPEPDDGGELVQEVEQVLDRVHVPASREDDAGDRRHHHLRC